ncbi:BQ5605_C005g03637 [Microbotryum silenes-dioicae]|uniref:BQ5605_C005g03637 protein n=1 Tax=Microbotryum silenes-dioicae TaxID=796604 RepID=A0A2X0PDI5_9BASI|nr:BQ5605_C005g03637 [Microbotryum silenes-dioicae]
MHLQVLNDLHHSNTMSSNPLFDSSMSYKTTCDHQLATPQDRRPFQSTVNTLLDAHADYPGTRLKGQHRRVLLEKYICNWAGSPRAVAESLISCLSEGHVSRDHHQKLHRVRQEISLIVTGFVRRRSSRAETQRQNTAQSTEWSRANDMVTEMDDDGDIYVTSFGEDEQEDEDSTFIETSYIVGLNPTDSSVISTCDCPDFVRHMFPCKHMWLAALQAIPNNTAEHEDRIQLYRRLAEEAGRVHAKLLRTLQELKADKCNPHGWRTLGWPRLSSRQAKIPLGKIDLNFDNVTSSVTERLSPRPFKSILLVHRCEAPTIWPSPSKFPSATCGVTKMECGTLCISH